MSRSQLAHEASRKYVLSVITIADPINFELSLLEIGVQLGKAPALHWGFPPDHFRPDNLRTCSHNPMVISNIDWVLLKLAGTLFVLIVTVIMSAYAILLGYVNR